MFQTSTNKCFLFENKKKFKKIDVLINSASRTQSLIFLQKKILCWKILVKTMG